MKIMFCGGGTFGHIAPSLAVAAVACKKHRDIEVIFVGRKGGKENEAVRALGYPLREISAQGFSLRPKSVSGLWHSMREARQILQKEKPQAVFGTGGYVCFPMLYQAQRMGIPTAMHESNAVPGRACRVLARGCDAVMLGFDAARAYLPKKANCIFTGNPAREDFFAYSRRRARALLGIPERARLLLSFGGSGGAARINQAMLAFMEDKAKGTKDFFHFHATGKNYYAAAAEKHPSFARTNGRLRIYPFIDNMPLYMKAADLCVCRSGAMTVAELCAAGTPAILVPSPNVSQNHQHKNAKSICDRGGAVLCDEAHIDRIGELILENLFDEPKLSAMKQNLTALCIKDAAERIFDSILSILPNI